MSSIIRPTSKRCSGDHYSAATLEDSQTTRYLEEISSPLRSKSKGLRLTRRKTASSHRKGRDQEEGSRYLPSPPLSRHKHESYFVTSNTESLSYDQTSHIPSTYPSSSRPSSQRTNNHQSSSHSFTHSHSGSLPSATTWPSPSSLANKEKIGEDLLGLDLPSPSSCLSQDQSRFQSSGYLELYSYDMTRKILDGDEDVEFGGVDEQVERAADSSVHDSSSVSSHPSQPSSLYPYLGSYDMTSRILDEKDLIDVYTDETGDPDGINCLGEEPDEHPQETNSGRERWCNEGFPGGYNTTTHNEANTELQPIFSWRQDGFGLDHGYDFVDRIGDLDFVPRL